MHQHFINADDGDIVKFACKVDIDTNDHLLIGFHTIKADYAAFLVSLAFYFACFVYLNMHLHFFYNFLPYKNNVARFSLFKVSVLFKVKDLEIVLLV